MTWTATLDSAINREEYWKIVITFTDGVNSVQKSYRYNGTTVNGLKAFVRQKAQEFETNDTAIDFTQFIGQSIDVTPPVVTPPDPPTQAELDKIAWFDDYRQLQAMLKVTSDVPALLNAQATTAIANLRTSLEAGWLNSYLGDI